MNETQYHNINNILQYYQGDNLGCKVALTKVLMQGRLAGTGKMVILPVDQGFEHGPDKSFADNISAYDPEYHIKLAIEAKLNAFVAPVGMIETINPYYRSLIPVILKVNSANSLTSKNFDNNQAITANVQDALRLGCIGIGFTIYPGSDYCYHMIEKFTEIAHKAKKNGLLVVVWSYPRGKGIENTKDNTALDVTAYAAHIAALIGAHIIKVKLPTHVRDENQKFIHDSFDDKVLSNKYSTSEMGLDKIESQKWLTAAVEHIKQSCFAGKRLVIFSGGGQKDKSSLLQEITAINQGKGNGSIIGRNVFQREKHAALALLDDVMKIYEKS